MTRTPGWALRALFACLSGILSGAMHAADTANGQTLYNSICAACHKPGGFPGPGPIMLGANNPEAIAAALVNVPEMQPFARLLTPGDIQDIAAYLGVLFGVPPPPLPATAVAIEYYHAVFDHYFITTIADEITKLDNGTISGWARTGRQFNVFASATAGLSPVCRFFSAAFAPKSSHFYTALPSECSAVKTNTDWVFEAEVFWVGSPASDGSCAVGTIPVYRIYNNGQGGAPNHRFTTDVGVQSAMIAKGWIPEGQGVGVTMCVPA